MSIVGLFWSRYGALFLAGLFFVGAEAFCDLLQPTLLAHLVDRGVEDGRRDIVFSQGCLMLGVVLLGALAALARNRLASVVSQRFGADLRSGLYRGVQAFSHKEFDKFDSGTLVTRLTNDVTQVQNFVNGTMRVFAKAPLLGVGALVMAVLLDARLSLVLLAVVPMVVLVGWINARKGYPLYRRVQNGVDRVNSLVREVLRGVRVVKAFDQFDTERERFEQENRRLSEVSTRAGRVVAIFNPVVSLIVNLGIVAILWWGGFLVFRHGLGVGKIIAYVNYVTQILFALVMMGFVLMTFVRAKASQERLQEIWKIPSPILSQKKETSVSVGFISLGNLEAKNLGFSYPGSETATLSDLNFFVQEGTTVGVLGGMGSGKSTLAKLLPRFYDPTEGTLILNGRSIQEWDEGRLRDLIAWVPEKATLFGGTIQENLLWGREDANQDDLRAAAKLAGALGFVEGFPDGWNTLVGQGGVTLSGGQKQRLTIARALVRRPSLLVLDDSFSSLDAITESEILSNLRSLTKVTIFHISQKISSVKNADLILVLDQGRLVGKGTSSELLRDCRVYREILESQTGTPLLARKGNLHG